MKYFIVSYIMVLSILLGVGMLFANDEYFQNKQTFEPYEIGIPKQIDIYGGLILQYKNEIVSDRTVQMLGSVKIDIKYKIEKLEVNYHIIGADKKTVRVSNLTLMKGAYPNTFEFELVYPLDLNKYEYEIFSMVILIDKDESANEI